MKVSEEKRLEDSSSNTNEEEKENLSSYEEMKSSESVKNEKYNLET